MAQTRNVYLDHAATTPVDPQVIEAMLPYFSETYGNPSSMHRWGRAAEQAIEESRQRVAHILGCQPQEIIFTSCGSESDNLALRGTMLNARRHNENAHLITTPIEHVAVGQTARQLADLLGCGLTIIPVDRYGQVDPEDVAAAFRKDTVLVSVMYANNEIGTVQPIRQIAEQTHERGALLHTDAVQAAGQLPLNVKDLGVDMLAISAHKFYGPKGVGALYVKDGITLIPSQSGGGHENGRRAGTHNVAFIVGLATALELAYADFKTHTAHYQRLRDRLIAGILERIPETQLTGHPQQRLPAHASFVFRNVDGNALLMHLDLKGIAASSGSACKTGNPEPSAVLLSMCFEPEWSLGSLRLTVGRQTTVEDIDYAIDVIANAVDKLRLLKD